MLSEFLASLARAVVCVYRLRFGVFKETHFALLKRTAKKNIVEIFNVTSGEKRIQNALQLLDRAVKTIKSKTHVKNKLSCTAGYGCEFYKTKYCT